MSQKKEAPQGPFHIPKARVLGRPNSQALLFVLPRAFFWPNFAIRSAVRSAVLSIAKLRPGLSPGPPFSGNSNLLQFKPPLKLLDAGLACPHSSAPDNPETSLAAPSVIGHLRSGIVIYK